ncbi:hypothetical protein MATL_G00172070 [Megalops atlanticus]|uniref:Uncharacterized protein n=1 Tax=Megalops atlanticus TaxID=7932 RepID=A0A9D3PT70_MEGAT|nr:hypothetical protein MATL_G00172070 [Megalops atlanticus]
MADLLGMERAIQRLTHGIDRCAEYAIPSVATDAGVPANQRTKPYDLLHLLMGVLDVKDFWLTKQPVDVICDLELEFGETSLLLWFYSTEFLCVLCYNGRRDPPQWELLQKTCCFIKQLNASNWNLTFTDSGHPLMVDIPLAATQWQGLAIWEEENELDD